MSETPTDPRHTVPSIHPDPAIQRRALLAGLGGLAAGAFLTRNAAAGPLNPPPGPITSTGKTLVEVEPRIAINAANTPGDASSVFRITQPGSYYLTGNVTGIAGRSGIVIDASNVSLDLMGFAMIGVAGSIHGITHAGNRENIMVRNGAVSEWGQSGISFLPGGSTLTNAVIENIIVSKCASDAIRVNNNTRICACIVQNNFAVGVTTGDSCVVERCLVRSNIGNGIEVGTTSRVSDCIARVNFTGISVGEGSLVKDCIARLNASNGIRVTDACTVVGCLCDVNSGGLNPAGILVSGPRCRIEANSCMRNGRGIRVLSTDCFIARNTCSGNGTNWDIAAGNKCLVINGVTAGAINGNSGGVSPGSSDPNANYTY